MGNCENIYVLQNTLKSNTNIGIDFNGNNGDSQSKSHDQPRFCVAMHNYVEKSVCPYDTGDGIYADGARNILISENTVTKSDCGIEVGAEATESNNPVTNIVVENNKLIDNTEASIKVGGFENECYYVKNTVFKNNIMTKAKSSIIIAKSDNITFIGNIISGASNYFAETDDDIKRTYYKNLKFEKNIFKDFRGEKEFYFYKEEWSKSKFLSKYPHNTFKKK